MLDQSVNFANQLIMNIAAYTIFILIYGTAFFCMGMVICRIIHSIYNWLRPMLDKWFQSLRKK